MREPHFSYALGRMPRVRFTLELWERWRQAREPTPQTLRLRAGIQSFRRMLEREKGAM